MAQNRFQGKFQDGTFAQGEGPVMGQTVVNERENAGLISGGEGGGKNLSQNSGPTTVTPPTPGADKLFSLRGSSYAGPENWAPEDKGTVNPFDLS